jgi:hypothetical protein
MVGSQTVLFQNGFRQSGELEQPFGRGPLHFCLTFSERMWRYRPQVRDHSDLRQPGHALDHAFIALAKAQDEIG